MVFVKVVRILANLIVPLVLVVQLLVELHAQSVVVAQGHVQDVLVPVLLVLLVQGVQGVKAVAIRVLQGAPQIVRRAVRITVVQAVHLRLDRVLSEHK